jgi:hypothetical protein
VMRMSCGVSFVLEASHVLSTLTVGERARHSPLAIDWYPSIPSGIYVFSCKSDFITFLFETTKMILTTSKSCIQG